MNHSHQAEFVDLTTEGRSTCLAISCATKSAEHSLINPGKQLDSHVPGMETVIVTVSGYDSLSRIKLVKLINHIGALNTGSLSNCNTHVVCWEFVGRKYELAKKLRKKVISHRWFEDCLKAGVLLPEEPYINKSGEEEAPLCWNGSVVDLHHSKALRKVDSMISLTESVSQPESSSGWDKTTISTKVHGLSAYKGRSSDVDHSDTGWILTSSSKRAVSSNPSPRARIRQAVPSCAAHLSQEQKRDECSQKALKISDDETQQTKKPPANQVPAELGTEKAVGVSDPIGAPFSDQSDMDGIRHQGGKGYISRPYSTEVGQQPRLSCFPPVPHNAYAGHQDYKADYAQIRLRKRKEVEVPSGGLSEKYRKLMNESPDLTSCKLGYGDERAGSQSRTCSTKYLGSPSSQHSTRTVSAVVEVDNQRDTYILVNIDNTDLFVEEPVVFASSSKDIACVICHTETKPTTEGLLECGHRYCYPCIQKWADEGTSKQSTCPLCKASFEFITIRELERSANEEICTQVLEERVVLVGKQIRQGQKINLLCTETEGICITCESKDSPELLMSCSRCGQRFCHTFCLDPPLPSGSFWFCSRCSPMRSRYLSRETVMSRFST